MLRVKKNNRHIITFSIPVCQKTTKTKFCSLTCSSKAYKKRTQQQKIANSNLETTTIRIKQILELKDKEFLTVKEVALLLGFAPKTIYRLISQNKIIAYNFSQRMTVIKRSELDALFLIIEPNYEIVMRPKEKKTNTEIADCYTITEIQQKFNFSSRALYNIIKRNSIHKFIYPYYSNDNFDLCYFKSIPFTRFDFYTFIWFVSRKL